jgi:hypothetical protein
MPATANIVIADNVPSNHTLVPQTATMGLSSWIGTAASTFDGNLRLALTMSPPSKSRATTRIKESFVVPFERDVDGVILVQDSISFFTDAVIPKTVSAAEALKAYTLWKNLQANAFIQAYLANREPAY